MDRALYAAVVSTAVTLLLGTAALGADPRTQQDNTWLALLNGTRSVPSAAALEGSPINALLERPTMNVAQTFTPSNGSAELTGSLVACGLLYRILRRRRAL